MRESARSGDGTALAREAHRLAGSGSSIGVAGFARGCLDI
jgi:HPt (histidine-containing phosphotransfer) domain-containing protein